jgi:hypothetical protein
LAVRHPVVLIVALFILLVVSLVVASFFGAPRILGKYWGKDVYIMVMGAAFVYLTLSDRRRKKATVHHVSSADTGILQRSQTLSSQITNNQLRLDDLKWAHADPRSNILTGSNVFPSDQGVVKDNVLYLPGELKGRLQENELDPLIGSSLILHSDPKISRKATLAVTGFMIIPLFLLIAVLALVGPILEPGTIITWAFTVGIVISAFLIIFGGGYLIARTQRRMVLDADRKAAGLVGKEPLVQTLKKLAEMELPDQQRLKKRRNYLLANYDDSSRPSLDERINNLQKQ